jgi:hypothetical protein
LIVRDDQQDIAPALLRRSGAGGRRDISGAGGGQTERRCRRKQVATIHSASESNRLSNSLEEASLRTLSARAVPDNSDIASMPASHRTSWLDPIEELLREAEGDPDRCSPARAGQTFESGDAALRLAI